MNGYPYPVLTEVDSSYKENINFDIEFLKYDYETEKVKLSLGINLTSESLKEYIQRGDAKFVIKTVTNIRSQVHTLAEYQEHTESWRSATTMAWASYPSRPWHRVC